MGDSTGYQWLEFPQLCRRGLLFVGYSADRFVGGPNVPVSIAAIRSTSRNGICWLRFSGSRGCIWPRKPCLFIVPVQGVHAGSGQLVVLQTISFSFGSGSTRPRHCLLHDSESDWPARLQLSPRCHRLLDVCVLCSSWTGMQRLVDGPFPAWMITASIAAMILCIIPVATVRFESSH